MKVSSSSSDATPSVRRSKIVLNLLQHFGGTQIESILNVVQLAYNSTAALIDYAYENGVINKGNGATFNGANLNINKLSGTSTLPYINYPTDINSPSKRINSSGTAVAFNYNYRNGSGGFTITANTSLITPDVYDTGTGTPVAVANNKWTIQRVYYFPQSDKFGVVLGQAEYASSTDAQAAIFTENPIINPLSESGTFVTAIIIKKGATVLNSTTSAVFQTITTSSSSGGATSTSLQSAYNVNPLITTTTALGAVTHRRGSAADTDVVFEIENGAGTATNVITGLGWHGIGTSAPTGSLDVSATVYNP